MELSKYAEFGKVSLCLYLNTFISPSP